MFNINPKDLENYSLILPSPWINAEDHNIASMTLHVLGLINDLFIEAVASYACYQPITKEMLMATITANKSPYEKCLNNIYAKTFVYSLNNILNLLKLLTNIKYNPPLTVIKYCEEYQLKFKDIRHIRDSLMHIENRGVGEDKYGEQINSNLLVVGGFLDNRYCFSGSDGKVYEIEISEKTLIIVKDILQNVINSYSWKKIGDF
jgi:hypothetical protein